MEINSLITLIGLSFMLVVSIIIAISIIIEDRKRNEISLQKTNAISDLLFFVITCAISKFSKRIPDKRTHNSTN